MGISVGGYGNKRLELVFAWYGWMLLVRAWLVRSGLEIVILVYESRQRVDGSERALISAPGDGSSPSDEDCMWGH